VVGQGYVGLPVAIRAVEAGFDVVGFDIEKTPVDCLRKHRHMSMTSPQLNEQRTDRVLDNRNRLRVPSATRLQGEEVLAIPHLRVEQLCWLLPARDLNHDLRRQLCARRPSAMGVRRAVRGEDDVVQLSPPASVIGSVVHASMPAPAIWPDFRIPICSLGDVVLEGV
jgi:nucleoside-diphosphate-sugar epimerase